MPTTTNGNAISATYQEITSQEQLMRVVYDFRHLGTHHKIRDEPVQMSLLAVPWYDTGGDMISVMTNEGHLCLSYDDTCGKGPW